MKKIIEIEKTNRQYHKCIVCGIKSELQIIAIGHEWQDESVVNEIVICEECIYNLGKVIVEKNKDYISNSNISKKIMEINIEKLVTYIKLKYQVEICEIKEGSIYVGNKLQGRHLSCEEKRRILIKFDCKHIFSSYQK